MLSRSSLRSLTVGAAAALTTTLTVVHPHEVVYTTSSNQYYIPNFMKVEAQARTNQAAPSPDADVLALALKGRCFTVEELRKYDGSAPAEPIYLACKGVVFDVTGAGFYGPGSGYNVFAGKDGSAGLARMDTNNVEGGPDDLSEQELVSLQSWFKRFSEKYTIVGTVANSPWL